MKLFTVAAAFAVFCLGAVVFTSCNKANCNMVTCSNGGTCSDGKCTCPTGYSGLLCDVKGRTAVQYKNNTFTPVSITTLDGDAKVVPVGGTATFVGEVGSVIKGTATTYGSASIYGVDNPAGILGTTMSWATDNVFPDADTVRAPLDIPSGYFYLKVINTGNTDINSIYVNAGFPYGQVYQNVTIPHDGVAYGMGYYLAYVGANVQIQTSDTKVIKKEITLPFTANQSVTVTF